MYCGSLMNFSTGNYVTRHIFPLNKAFQFKFRSTVWETTAFEIQQKFHFTNAVGNNFSSRKSCTISNSPWFYVFHVQFFRNNKNVVENWKRFRFKFYFVFLHTFFTPNENVLTPSSTSPFFCVFIFPASSKRPVVSLLTLESPSSSVSLSMMSRWISPIQLIG